MRYLWKRFWCPRDGVINDSDGGFLVDPESEEANWVNSDVVSFDKIKHLPCLALLGEPGIGKTTAMEDLRGSLQQSVSEAGELLLCINLNEFGDESRLIQEVFESQTFLTWTGGRHVLHLFLDSLDECRLRITQVATIIKNRLQQVSAHLPRLRLRIACRTADWPDTLELSFPSIWGEDAYGAYELAPLRRKDIQIATKARDVDAAQFLAEVARTETAALANKPITLEFLMTAFKDSGQLPASRRELYECGCGMLCDERNPDRRNSNEMGALSVDQRLAVASRIAAVSILCRKPTILIGPISSDQIDEEVHISDLVGGNEPAGIGFVDATEAAISEALRTGLFTARGSQRLGFAHQTYTEFLASRYLAAHDMGTQKVLALLCHPDDPDGHVIPQLYETVGWVASDDKDILAAIVECDPQVLLRGDTGSLTDHERQMIVEALLEAFNERRANDRDWDLHRKYNKLNHEGLAEQLRLWISDQKKHDTARYVAIDIAEACEVQELQSILADLTLDESEEPRLRDNAAYALVKIANVDTRRRLLPLALGQAGDDPQDQLKGNALRALWPDLISAEELFQNLTLPKQQNFHGAYCGFLERELAQHLKTDDLPHALRWLKGLVAQKRLGFYMERLSDKIIIKAWEEMSSPSVLEALAETSNKLLRNYHDLIQGNEKQKEHTELFDDPDSRRALTKAIIALDSEEHTCVELTWRWPRLIRLDDFEWCITQLLSSIGSEVEPVWAELVWRLFCPSDEPNSGQLEMIMTARTQSDALREESELFFTPIGLNSKRAQKSREQHKHAMELCEQPEPEVLEWLPRDRIKHCLDRFNRGEYYAWWLLLDQMTLEDTSTDYKIVPLDIRKLPGWQKADPATRRRILTAADHFSQHGPVDPLKWVRQPHAWSTSDIAGYVALYLLKQEAQEAFNSLPSAIWQRHVANVLCCFAHNADDGEKKQHEEIALRCYQQAKEAVLFYFPLQLDAEDREGKDISCDQKLRQCWDDDLKQTLYEKLVEAQEYWQPDSFDHVATLLLTHGHEPTRNLLVTLVQSVAEGTCGNSELARIAATNLITHSPDAAWPIIWPAIQADREFGRELLMTVAHGLHHNAAEVASKLTEEQLADLFIWLVKEFPFSEDREHDRGYSPSRDDSVREFRDDIVRFLEAQGTPRAVTALEAASNALPDLDWLRSTIIEARKNSLRKTWTPLAPSELIELVTRPRSSLVRNADELQELILETLAVLEVKLQGENPAASELWDQIGRTKFRPKDENHLSDWIKRHLVAELKSRGVVMAREDRIRQGEGSGKGEEIDIPVTAVIPGLTPGAWDQVKVIIETKGCWNKDLKTDMQDQLVDRYLKDNQCRHGIYLVGWYMCDQWDDDHYQKKNTPGWSLDEARTFFSSQADGMPADMTIKAFVLNTGLR